MMAKGIIKIKVSNMILMVNIIFKKLQQTIKKQNIIKILLLNKMISNHGRLFPLLQTMKN